MLEGVITAVASALCAAGISAGPAYPNSSVTPETAFVRVGVLKAADKSAGLSRYLGMRNDPERGAVEVYGLRCELELSLDVYAPLHSENAALACGETFDRAAEVISGVAGLHLRELVCGAPGPDAETGMFRLSGSVKCAGLLTIADSDGGGSENSAFTDFVLRGELQR